MPLMPALMSDSTPVSEHKDGQLADLISVRVSRYELKSKKIYFVCQANVDGKNLVLYRTYDDFYKFQLRMLDAFHVKGMERIIPYLPGPKIFVTERVCKKRVKKLDDYFQDLLHLEPRIAQSTLVYEFLKEKTEDVAWNDVLYGTAGGKRRIEESGTVVEGKSTGTAKNPCLPTFLESNKDK
ncbi:Phox homologous domain-containing protein [Chytridium lagenaria]|nr:Phox homologous domain-containing protein [Chytridium lagenaria]